MLCQISEDVFLVKATVLVSRLSRGFTMLQNASWQPAVAQGLMCVGAVPLCALFCANVAVINYKTTAGAPSAQICHYAVELELSNGAVVVPEREHDGVKLRQRDLAFERGEKRTFVWMRSSDAKLGMRRFVIFFSLERSTSYCLLSNNCKHLVFHFYSNILGHSRASETTVDDFVAARRREWLAT